MTRKKLVENIKEIEEYFGEVKKDSKESKMKQKVMDLIFNEYESSFNTVIDWEKALWPNRRDMIEPFKVEPLVWYSTNVGYSLSISSLNDHNIQR